jgi:hypothetical protein
MHVTAIDFQQGMALLSVSGEKKFVHNKNPINNIQIPAARTVTFTMTPRFITSHSNFDGQKTDKSAYPDSTSNTWVKFHSGWYRKKPSTGTGRKNTTRQASGHVLASTDIYRYIN